MKKGRGFVEGKNTENWASNCAVIITKLQNFLCSNLPHSSNMYIRQVSPFRPRRLSGRVEVQLYSILELGTRRGEGSASCSGRNLPGKDPVLLYRRMGGPQGRSGQVWKISPCRDSIPGTSSLQAVAIPAKLPRPNMYITDLHIYSQKGYTLC